MFHWLLTNFWYKQTAGNRLLFRQTGSGRSRAIVSGLNRFAALSYAPAPNGYVYMANGLGPMLKWNGYLDAAVLVGVPAPELPITVSGEFVGTLTGTYTAYQRWLDIDGNPSNLSPVSEEIAVKKVAQFTYDVPEVPTDARVVKRQILRNTHGQASVYYVDVESEDLAEIRYTSTRTDDELSTQEAVALFDDRGNVLANRFSIPHDDKPLVAYYLGRMFAAGDVPYNRGCCSVTAGLRTVTGVGTSWTSYFAGRLFYVPDAPRPYEIESVDEVTQTLTLTEFYRSRTDVFSDYIIRSSPGERNLLRYTEAGLFDAWSEFNGLEIGTGEELADEITGLLATNSFLFILQRHHVYRLTYQRDPGIDGGVFLSLRRGCVNNRCWVHVDGATYMMDSRGIYKFDGGDGAEDISGPIQDIFRESDGKFSINWEAIPYFHAVHNRADNVIRFFVAMSGQRLPRHALVWNYVIGQWWIEEYKHPIGASQAVELGLEAREIVAGPASRVFVHGLGNLDGTDPASGTNRSTVTSAGFLSITDVNATFTDDLAGVPVSIIAGRGKGQTRIVSDNTTTILTFSQPWLVKPDTTSQYQVGGVPWKWRGPWHRWRKDENETPRSITLTFTPTDDGVPDPDELPRSSNIPIPSICDFRLYEQHHTEPKEWGLDWPNTPKETSGWTSQKDDPDVVVNLSDETGEVQVRMDDRLEEYAERSNVISPELRGVSGAKDVLIHELTIEGAG